MATPYFSRLLWITSWSLNTILTTIKLFLTAISLSKSVSIYLHWPYIPNLSYIYKSKYDRMIEWHGNNRNSFRAKQTSQKVTFSHLRVRFRLRTCAVINMLRLPSCFLAFWRFRLNSSPSCRFFAVIDGSFSVCTSPLVPPGPVQQYAILFLAPCWAFTHSTVFSVV